MATIKIKEILIAAMSFLILFNSVSQATNFSVSGPSLSISAGENPIFLSNFSIVFSWAMFGAPSQITGLGAGRRLTY